MSGKEVSMRNAREILRLRIGQGMSVRQVSSSCGVSISTVSEYEKRFRESGLEWPPPEDLDDVALERVLRSGRLSGPTRQMPDIGHLVKELKRPHVTMQLLWVEYRETFPEGYGYTQFCHWIKEQRPTLDVTLRQEHKANESLHGLRRGNNPISTQDRQSRGDKRVRRSAWSVELHLCRCHTRYDRA